MFQLVSLALINQQIHVIILSILQSETKSYMLHNIHAQSLGLNFKGIKRDYAVIYLHFSPIRPKKKKNGVVLVTLGQIKNIVCLGLPYLP